MANVIDISDSPDNASYDSLLDPTKYGIGRSSYESDGHKKVVEIYREWVEDEDYYKTIMFDCKNDRTKFLSELWTIKSEYDNVEFHGANHHDYFDKRAAEQWLMLCCDFIETWGEKRIPKDVRIHFNEALDFCGEEEKYDFGEDVGYHPPTDDNNI